MSDEADPLSELLHELSLGLFKTHLLLSEATPEQWKAYAGRLDVLKGLVSTFPTSPRARRSMGFLAPVAKRKKG